MTERSGERTVDGEIGDDGPPPDGKPAERSTADLLAETERLLDDDLAGGVDSRETSSGSAAADPSPESSDGGWRSYVPDVSGLFGSTSKATSDASGGSGDSTTTAGPSMREKLAPTRYFSPKAFLALVLTLAAGMLAGATLVPFFATGRLLGILVMAFVIGLVTSKRRYLEVATAGAAVGVVGALFNVAIVLPLDLGGSIVATGTSAGLVGSLLSYYFGRDLRNGLVRDLERG